MSVHYLKLRNMSLFLLNASSDFKGTDFFICVNFAIIAAFFPLNVCTALKGANFYILFSGRVIV